MAWVYLVFAIAFETVGTSAMKASDGFTRLGPSILSAASYAAALFLLSLVLRTIPIGVAYAIWSGLGIVLISAIGWAVFGQRLDLPALVGMGLIVVGIIVMQVFSNTTGS